MGSAMDRKERKKRESKEENDHGGEEGAFEERGGNSRWDREYNNRGYQAREGEMESNRCM